MILEYHRPQSLEDALALVARTKPPTVPLGGGTVLTQPSSKVLAVVDLQDLDLDSVTNHGNSISIGAMVRLAGLMDFIKESHPIHRVIRLEASHNLRQAASVAGTLVAGGGRSPMTCAFLALNAAVKLLPGPAELALGDLLPVRREKLKGKLITEITIPRNASLVYDSVARSPADSPLVSVAVAYWPSGRTRVALGGYGEQPILAFDGPEPAGAEIAARDAYSHAGDAWATSEYRQETAQILVSRALKVVKEGQNP